MQQERILHSAYSRLNDPGFLYNLGNGLGFAVGVAVALAATAPEAQTQSISARLLAHVAGSPSAAALTAATAVFFWGGAVYSSAWKDGPPPDARLNRQGDILSGIGAVMLGIGLFLLGNPVLAAFAGVMHAVGKFGSALNTTIDGPQSPARSRIAALCKDLVIVSRAPAILAGVLAVWREMTVANDPSGLLLSLSFVICCVIWAAADWKLLSPQGGVRQLAQRFV